jgi:NADPH2:quinone reductase
VPWGDGGLPTLFHSVADPAERAWRCGDLFWWMAAGARDVCIDRTWPLSAAARAHRDIEGGNTQGKVLLLP